MTSHNAASTEKYVPIEKYITHIPFIAVALALTFDVGTFYAIGIDYFTLFSLSEHVVFALEALPVAIALLFCVAALLPAALSRSNRLTANASRPPVRPNKYQYIAAIILLILLVGGLISFVAYAIYEEFRANQVSGLLTVFIMICFVPALGTFFIDPRFKQAHVFVSAVLVCVGVSFSFGFAFGHGMFGAEAISTVRLKSNLAPIEGRIIRSGERGVLLYDSESKLVRFERWETISSIEARSKF